MIAPNASAGPSVSFAPAQGNTGGCLWSPLRIPLAGKTLRAYYEYRFAYADTYAIDGDSNDRRLRRHLPTRTRRHPWSTRSACGPNDLRHGNQPRSTRNDRPLGQSVLHRRDRRFQQFQSERSGRQSRRHHDQWKPEPHISFRWQANRCVAVFRLNQCLPLSHRATFLRNLLSRCIQPTHRNPYRLQRRLYTVQPARQRYQRPNQRSGGLCCLRRCECRFRQCRTHFRNDQP